MADARCLCGVQGRRPEFQNGGRLPEAVFKPKRLSCSLLSLSAAKIARRETPLTEGYKISLPSSPLSLKSSAHSLSPRRPCLAHLGMRDYFLVWKFWAAGRPGKFTGLGVANTLTCAARDPKIYTSAPDLICLSTYPCTPSIQAYV